MRIAEKWIDLFRNNRTVARTVTDSAFANDCSALDFQMDCRYDFEAICPKSNAFNDSQELDKTIAVVDDISLFESAIFSKCRYLTHWAGPGEDILSFWESLMVYHCSRQIGAYYS
ncbi:MAG: hypothetical protein RRZ24_11310 [Clostridia bacterium]